MRRMRASGSPTRASRPGSSLMTTAVLRSRSSFRRGRIAIESLLVDEQHGRSRVVQAVDQLVGGPPGVEGNDDRPRNHRSPKGDDPLGQVSRGDGDAIALGDAIFDEALRERGRETVVLLEGVACWSSYTRKSFAPWNSERSRIWRRVAGAFFQTVKSSPLTTARSVSNICPGPSCESSLPRASVARHSWRDEATSSLRSAERGCRGSAPVR